VDERDGNKEVYFLKTDPAGNILVGPLNISQSSGTSSIDPDIAVDASGNAHICWQEGTANGEGTILLSRVNSSGAEYLNNLIVSASFSAYPAVAATGPGESWVGFRRRESASLYRIYSGKVNTSGTKICEKLVADNSLLALDNSVSIDWNPSGQVIATFHDIYNFQEFAALQIWSGSCAAGCAGGCGSRCQWFNSNNIEHTSLTSPLQNVVYVVFENDPGSGRGIYTLTACNGAALLSDTPGPAVNPSISTPEGISWPLVVWEDRSGALAEIRLRQENRQTPSSTISTGPGNSRNPDIAVKSAVNWGAVWDNARSGSAEVYFISTEVPIVPPVVLEPSADSFWLTGEMSQLSVRWSAADSRIDHVGISFSGDGGTSWTTLTSATSASTGVWSGSVSLPLADTTGAKVQLHLYDAAGNVLDIANSSDFAAGNNNSIRLDVQRNNESQFSPPVLYWDPVSGAASYSVYVVADQSTSCSYQSWPQLLPASRNWVVFDRDKWQSFPATRCNVTVTALSSGGTPILPRQTWSFVRFRLSDLDPYDGESKPPVLLVHGWTSDQSTWYSCNGSPLIQRLINGPGTRRHPWAIEYPNTGSIRYSAAGLDSALKYLRRTILGAPPVSIIAHSMGGLVSRAAIEGLALDPGDDQPRAYGAGSVQHLATLSSPHLGEPNTGTASWVKGLLRICPNVDKSQSFRDLDHTGAFIRLLDETPLPAIRYLFCAGTRDECDKPGTLGCLGKQSADARFKLQCSAGNDNVVDVCSARAECDTRATMHGVTAPGATIIRLNYELSHDRMSRPGQTFNCFVTPPQVYDRQDARESSTRLLDDLIAFLDDEPDLQSQPCPLSPGQHFTFKFWQVLGLQPNASTSLAGSNPRLRPLLQAPLVGAQVQLSPVDVAADSLDYYTTDQAGLVRTTLLPGRYLLSVLASGYVARRETLVVSGNGDEMHLEMNVFPDGDFVGPTSPLLTIAGGASTVSDSLVTLVLSCTGATEVKVGEGADLDGEPWLPMSASLPDTLRGGEGLHLRYARFRDDLGRESNAVVAAVRLNTAQSTGISVSAIPMEATATVDGMPNATSTPALFDALEPGFHYASVRRPGWISNPGVQIANVDSGTIVPVSFQLALSQPPSASVWQTPQSDQYLGAGVQLEWTPGMDADAGDQVFYDLEIGLDAAVSAPVFTLAGATGTWAPLPAMLADSSAYFARISAVDGHETPQATPAEVVGFYVDRTPPTGHVLFPSKGAVVPGAAPPPLRFEVHDWSGLLTCLVTLSTNGGATYPDTLYAGAYADTVPWISPMTRSDNCRIRLVVADWAGNMASMESDSLFVLYGDLTGVGGLNSPTSLSLGVRPVPARSGAQVRFDLPKASDIRLEVFDVAGRSVRLLAAGPYAPGSYSLPWDLHDGSGRHLSTGVYFMRLHAGEGSRLGRIVIVE